MQRQRWPLSISRTAASVGLGVRASQSLSDWLARTKQPGERQLREMLSGHLCRCTGYAGVVRAALDAAAEMARDREKAPRDV